MRRHAHRVVRAPRIGWQRSYTYLRGRSRSGSVILVPASRDAPYGEVDARFWDWVVATILAVVVIAGVVLAVHAIT
jgi:hypothetical protein